MSKSVSVDRDIAALPATVWALVSDVTRMGEWSPETNRCSWLGDATGPAVGAEFRGTNSHRGRWWFTTCRITRCEPGRSFAFDVSFGPIHIAEWEYEFEPAPTGCRVTETFRDKRALPLALLGNAALGITDRAEHNRKTMVETLSRLANAAEKS
ncbi:MAG: SRPBCC family protein [Actinomycetota bacterium]